MTSTYNQAASLINTERLAGNLIKGCLPSLIGHLFSTRDMLIIAAQFDSICFDQQAKRFYDFEARPNAIHAQETAMAIIGQVLGMPQDDSRTTVQRLMNSPQNSYKPA